MKLDVLRIERTARKTIKDAVSEEVPLTLYINGEELLTLLCSPDNLKELSAGFLYSSGLIKSIKEIKNIAIDDQRWVSYVELNTKDVSPKLLFKRLYTSGCGRGTLFYNALDIMHRKKITSDFKLSSEKIIQLMHSFQKSSLVFKHTGGVHSAALSDGETMLVFKEDIGRHNALDKAIGEALVKGLNMKDLVVLTSGRVSSEIVLKAEKMKSAFLISRSAPTNQAVKLAEELNVTLIGFVRGSRMNVYTARERVV